MLSFKSMHRQHRYAAVYVQFSWDIKPSPLADRHTPMIKSLALGTLTIFDHEKLGFAKSTSHCKHPQHVFFSFPVHHPRSMQCRLAPCCVIVAPATPCAQGGFMWVAAMPIAGGTYTHIYIYTCVRWISHFIAFFLPRLKSWHNPAFHGTAFLASAEPNRYDMSPPKKSMKIIFSFLQKPPFD